MRVDPLCDMCTIWVGYSYILHVPLNNRHFGTSEFVQLQHVIWLLLDILVGDAPKFTIIFVQISHEMSDVYE